MAAYDLPIPRAYDGLYHDGMADHVKVRVECICWGAGTAWVSCPRTLWLRAHRLSGYDSDEEDEDMNLKNWKKSGSRIQIFDKAKLGVGRLWRTVGFSGFWLVRR
ncbi:Transmembrane protein 49, partial [Caligus rogercresseyi]